MVARPSARSRGPQASSGRRSDTGSARCSPTSTATAGSTCTSRTMPTRISSTATSPSDGAQPRLPLRGRRQAARSRRPERGHGHRRGRLQRRRPGRPVRHELAPPAPRRVPEPRAAGAPISSTRGPTSQPSSGPTRPRGATSWADLDLDGDLDLVVANGGIPVVNLAKDAQRVRILENVAPRSGWSPVRARHGCRAPAVAAVNGRGLATADYDNDGDLDIAVNAIGGRPDPPRERRHGAATGSRFASQLRARRARHRRATRRAAPRPRSARGSELPLVRGSSRPLRPRRRERSSSASRSGSRMARDVAAERRGRPGRRRRLSRHGD